MGMFESIIWQGKDTMLNRGYDINYLNPVIFFRPVEYAQGSSDNAIIGFNFQFKLHDNHQIYSQIVLDEFLLSEVKADLNHALKPNDTSIVYGWWANKYAVQLGYKWYDIAKIPDLDFQIEFNAVRPYMYSHGTINQNYGHFNQSLAHPRGSNFFELISIIRYRNKRFGIMNKFLWSIYGTDNNNINYGGNIYQSYQNTAGIYYNVIGQGLKNRLFFNELKFTYLINPVIDLNFQAGYVMRYNQNKEDKQLNNFIYLGLKTNLWNRYYDY